jgi:hypothetical protein
MQVLRLPLKSCIKEHGHGSGFGSFIVDEHNGTPVMWTLSEPFGARDWWPCKQDLNDKIDDGIDFYITAPTIYLGGQWR